MRKRKTSKTRRLGRWNVERERCHIGDKYPPPRFREAKAVGDVLSSVVDELGVADTQWMLTLADEWRSIVGAAVAKHTRPGMLDGRTLTVYVDSSVWLSEISRYGSREMLDSIRKQLGGDQVTRLNFRLDPGTREG